MQVCRTATAVEEPWTQKELELTGHAAVQGVAQKWHVVQTGIHAGTDCVYYENVLFCVKRANGPGRSIGKKEEAMYVKQCTPVVLYTGEGGSAARAGGRRGR